MIWWWCTRNAACVHKGVDTVHHILSSKPALRCPPPLLHPLIPSLHLPLLSASRYWKCRMNNEFILWEYNPLWWSITELGWITHTSNIHAEHKAIFWNLVQQKYIKNFKKDLKKLSQASAWKSLAILQVNNTILDRLYNKQNEFYSYNVILFVLTIYFCNYTEESVPILWVSHFSQIPKRHSRTERNFVTVSSVYFTIPII